MELVVSNILTPMVLCYVLGLLAGGLGSDLRIPKALYESITIYLLFAIGFKGGVEISKTGLLNMLLPAMVSILLGLLTVPLYCYPILRRLGKFTRDDSASIAAHYGSVSAVTFIAATNDLKAVNQPYESYATAFLAAMESPAILVGVLLGKLAGSKRRAADMTSLKAAAHEAVYGRK